MGIIRRRAAAIVAALCILGAVVVVGAAAPAGGTVFPSNCRGADAATDVLLSAGGSIPLPVEVTGDAPGTVAPDEGSFPVEFSWSLEVDGGNPGLAYLWDLVGVDSLMVEIVDVTLPVLVSGAGTTATDVTGTPPDGAITFVKGEKVFITAGPFAADIPITGTAGDQVFFAVGDPRLTMRVTLGALGAPIDLALVCDVGRLLTTTRIAVEGAPTIDAVDEQVARGGTLTIDVNDLVTEGDGPLIPGSLEIAEPPAAGTASLSDTGILTYDAPDADAEVWIGLRVCGDAAAEAGLTDPLCGAGTVAITVGSGVAAEPVPSPTPTGTPTPGVQATDQAPAPAPAASAVTGQPSFTG